MTPVQKFVDKYKNRPHFSVGPHIIAKVLVNGRLYIDRDYLKNPAMTQDEYKRFAQWMYDNYVSVEL